MSQAAWSQRISNTVRQLPSASQQVLDFAAFLAQRRQDATQGEWADLRNAQASALGVAQKPGRVSEATRQACAEQLCSHSHQGS